MMGGGDPADMQTDTIDLFHTLEDQMQAFDPKRHLDMESAKAAAAKASKNPTLSDLEQMKRSINGVVDELKLSDDRKKDRLAEKCRTKVLWVEWRYNEIIGKVRLNQWKDMVKAALTGEHGGVITSHAAIQPGRWQIIDSQIRDGFQSATEPIPKNVDETGVQDDSLKKLGDRMVGSHTLQLAIQIIDEDKLQQMWHDAVMALSLQDFYVDPALRKIADAEDLRQMLADESVIGDYTFEQNARSAWGVRLEDADPDDVQALIDKVEEKLSDWSYALAADECQQPMDEYAVLLDVYDHSGRSYSQSGGGVQCRWDTSRGEALWIADKYAKEEIDRQAKVYAFGKIQQFKSDKYYPSLDGAPICAEGTTVSYPGFEHWHEAFEWLKQRVANLGEPTDDQLLSGHNRALYEIASECVKTYNSWQCGDCYGVICVDYDAEGKQVGEADACWGYTGIDWARQERDSFVKGMNRV
jgi:hypothetical protein